MSTFKHVQFPSSFNQGKLLTLVNSSRKTTDYITVRDFSAMIRLGLTQNPLAK